MQNSLSFVVAESCVTFVVHVRGTFSPCFLLVVKLHFWRMSWLMLPPREHDKFIFFHFWCSYGSWKYVITCKQMPVLKNWSYLEVLNFVWLKFLKMLFFKEKTRKGLKQRTVMLRKIKKSPLQLSILIRYFITALQVLLYK